MQLFVIDWSFDNNEDQLFATNEFCQCLNEGNLNKTIMVGDSEVDGMSAENAKIPFVLVKDGYTEKSTKEIKHDELIEDFINFDKVIEKYL